MQNLKSDDEKSFENFISFQNMQKKDKKITIFNEDENLEEGNYIERGVSSINKENLEKTISFNASTQNQLQIVSYPQIFISYKNYSVLDNNERNMTKSSGNNTPWLHDKTQIAIQKYQTLSALIEKHLNDPHHPLFILKNEYIRCFVELNQKKGIKELHPNKLHDFQKEIRYMVRDIKSFAWVFKEAINNFYDLEEISQTYRTNDFDLFSDYNVMNFIYSLVFTDEIYSILFESLKQAEKYKEAIFKRNLDLLKNSPPEQFLVQHKFCLNQATADFFTKAHPENKLLSFDGSPGKKNGTQKIKTKKLNYAELQSKIFPHLLMNSFNKSEFLYNKVRSERSSKGRKTNEKFELPYSHPIDLLKNLQYLKNPAHKMKVITEAFDSIEGSIRDHYENFGYDEKYIVIEPEDLISIIVYVVCHSGLSHMVTHCNFIECFFNETNLSSKCACYLYSLKTAIEYILNAIEDNE